LRPEINHFGGDFHPNWARRSDLHGYALINSQLSSKWP
jgi:hypothetical protein